MLCVKMPRRPNTTVYTITRATQSGVFENEGEAFLEAKKAERRVTALSAELFYDQAAHWRGTSREQVLAEKLPLTFALSAGKAGFRDQVLKDKKLQLWVDAMIEEYVGVQYSYESLQLQDGEVTG